mmetsp:Transcript_35827/g.63962  ORF Transcript_35827/g.63962 Transcript_35827/m.63962 type:complete len:85 (+) Transcript_35827:183-437(+)
MNRGPTSDELAALQARASASLRSSWKFVPPHLDATPKVSVSHEQYTYIHPIPGTNKPPISIGNEFSAYVDRAIMLNVDLKRVGH